MFFLLPLPSVDFFISTTVRGSSYFFFLFFGKERKKQKERKPATAAYRSNACKGSIKTLCFPLLFRLISVIPYYTAPVGVDSTGLVGELSRTTPTSSGIRSNIEPHHVYRWYSSSN